MEIIPGERRAKGRRTTTTNRNQSTWSRICGGRTRRGLLWRRYHRILRCCNWTQQQCFGFYDGGTINSDSLTPYNPDLVSPPALDTIDSTLDIRESLPHTSVPADIIQVHSIYPSSIEDQSIIYDTDDPRQTSLQGNKAILAPNHSIKSIPISALESRYSDDRSLRGQIDTGAGISCSNALHLFHNYRKYNEMYKSTIQLSAAIRKGNTDANASVIPEGEGYLLIPAMNADGYIPIQAV